MKTLKVLFVMMSILLLVKVAVGQPDTLWTKIIEGHSAYSVLDDKLDGVIISTRPKNHSDTSSISSLFFINSQGSIKNQKEFIFEHLSFVTGGMGGYGLGGIEISRIFDNNLMLMGTIWQRSHDHSLTIGMHTKKVDSNLSVIFDRYYTLPPVDFAPLFCSNSDGGFMLSSIYGEIRKFDMNGDSVWSTEPRNYAYGLLDLVDGVLLMNVSKDVNNVEQLRLVKFDLEGNVIRDDMLIDSSRSSGFMVKCKTEDNGYFILNDFNHLARLDSSGLIISQIKLLDDSLNHDRHVSAINKTSDGGLLTLITDESNRDSIDLIVTKFNADGIVLWSKIIDSGYSDLGLYIQETSDKSYLLVGRDHYSDNQFIYIAKLESDVTRINHIKTIPSDYSFSQNYPNPFNPSTTIEFSLPKSEYVELKVYNILGKEVSTLVSKKLNQGNHSSTFDGKNLASGIYYYQLVAGDFREVKKMILLR